MSWIQNRKQGYIVTIMTLCLSLLFPLIQFTIIDLGRLYTIKEQLKFNLAAAVTSAVICVDWDDTYMGYFTFDMENCEDALFLTLKNNIDPDSAGEFCQLDMAGDIHRYRGRVGNVLFYAEIYNDFGDILLGGDRIPDDIVVNPLLVVSTDKPCVFIVAKYVSHPNLLMTVTGLGDLTLVQYASAELRSTDYEIN